MRGEYKHCHETTKQTQRVEKKIVFAFGTGAIEAMLCFVKQPRMTSSIVETDGILAPGQFHRAITTSEPSIALTQVVGLWKC